MRAQTIAACWLITAGCSDEPPAPLDLPASRYPEPLRPQVHFSPEAGWLNDPNGLVWFDDAWHLFYQHNPNAATFGPMSWGHAASTDLVHWTHLPVALSPDDVLGNAFSGSAVVADDTLQVLFTSSGGDDGTQKQTRASSADGLVFTPPVVVLPNPGEVNFRDPKVFPDGAGWGMALAVGDHVAFYRSEDLATWSWTSDFAPAVDGVIECPDLLLFDDRAALVFSTSTGGPVAGSGAWYVVGSFDGGVFTPDTSPRPFDAGADAYAFQSWANTPRHLGLSWMNNWRYALVTPTTGWRGAMTLPRELSLDGDELLQRPIPELDALEAGQATSSPQLRVQARLGAGDGLVFTNGADLHLRFDGTSLALDRTEMASFAGDFPAVHSAALVGDAIEVDVWLDASSVEVFAEGGKAVITDLVFPDGEAWSVTALGAAEITRSTALRTMWPAP